jgi:hypothetical protein
VWSQSVTIEIHHDVHHHDHEPASAAAMVVVIMHDGDGADNVSEEKIAPLDRVRLQESGDEGDIIRRELVA